MPNKFTSAVLVVFCAFGLSALSYFIGFRHGVRQTKAIYEEGLVLLGGDQGEILPIRIMLPRGSNIEQGKDGAYWMVARDGARIRIATSK